jgi:hypothetical protein
MGVQGKRVPSGGDSEIAAAQLDAARGTAQAFHRVVEFIPDIDFLLFDFADVDHMLVPRHVVPPSSFVGLTRAVMPRVVNF